MGKSKILSAIKAANDKLVNDIVFDLPVDRAVFKVQMVKPDNVEMAQVQEFAKSKALARAKKEGLEAYPVDEKKWQEFKEQSLKNMSNREQRREAERKLEADKPKNMAEQLASEAAWYETANRIIPGLLYSDGEQLFSTDEELEAYRVLIKDMKIFSLLMGKFAEVMSADKTAEEAVKN